MSHTENTHVPEREAEQTPVETQYEDVNLRRIAFYRKHHASLIRTEGIIGCQVDMKPGSIEPISIILREDCDLFAVQQAVHDRLQALGLVFQADYIFEKKKRGEFVQHSLPT